MPNLRSITLAFVTVAVLPACGPGSGIGDDFRQGEACGDAEVTSAQCKLDGERGLEFCAWDSFEMDMTWSACLVESCTDEGEARSCDGGQQFCVRNLTDDGREDLRWGECVAEVECAPGETRDCGLGEEFMLNESCRLDASGVPRWDFEACNTPLVLSFGDAVEFSAAPASAADFDIHGGPGVCTRADWPGAATPWLALDRDRSGSIDGGHELFGSGTRMAAGTGAPNGFLALAELDSDGDGKLGPADARWGELVLWADHDGDRRSSGWEVLPLESFEIVEIELAYDTRRACDGRGNCGLERAAFVYRAHGETRVGEVVDVHLACE